MVEDPTTDFMIFLGYCNHCQETIYHGYRKGIVLLCDCLEKQGVISIVRTVKTGPNGKKRVIRIILRAQGNLKIREQFIDDKDPTE